MTDQAPSVRFDSHRWPLLHTLDNPTHARVGARRDIETVPDAKLTDRASAVIDNVLYGELKAPDNNLHLMKRSVISTQLDALDPIDASNRTQNLSAGLGEVPVFSDLDAARQLSAIASSVLDAIEARETYSQPTRTKLERIRQAIGSHAAWGVAFATGAVASHAAVETIGSSDVSTVVAVAVGSSVSGTVSHLYDKRRRSEKAKLGNLLDLVSLEASQIPTQNTLSTYYELPDRLSNWPPRPDVISELDDLTDIDHERSVRSSILSQLEKIKRSPEYNKYEDVRFMIAEMFSEYTTTAQECGDIIGIIKQLLDSYGDYEDEGRLLIRRKLELEYKNLRETASAYEKLERQLCSFRDIVNAPGRITKIFETLESLADVPKAEDYKSGRMKTIALAYLQTYLSKLDISDGLLAGSVVADVLNAQEIYENAADRIPFDELLEEAERLLSSRLAEALSINSAAVEPLSADNYDELAAKIKNKIRGVETLPDLRDKIRALTGHVGTNDDVRLHGATNSTSK